MKQAQHRRAPACAALATAAIAGAAQGAGVPAAGLEEIVITAEIHTLYGDVDSATQGIVVSEQLEARPVLRTGELLEVVPGLIVTQHSGEADDSLFLPKLSFVFGPWAATELFVNAGRGFHSNDGRGTTTVVDPTDGVTPIAPADPLVAVTGYDIGVRTAALSNVQLAVSVWTLEFDSELLFIGDAGNTEANRGSRRYGTEVGL